MEDLLQNETAFLQAVGKISKMYPEFEKSVQLPSIIMLAQQSMGKSSLVDALSNINGFSDTGEGTKTRIPIKICLSTDPDGDPEPKIKFQGMDNTMTIKECQEFMNETNAKISKRKNPFLGVDKMIVFNVSSSECHNLFIIDLPGLRSGDNDNAADVEKIALELVRTITSSVILVLEGSEADWDNPSRARAIVEADEGLKRRSILVRTKLSLKLAQLKNPDEYVAQFMGGDSKSFPGWLSPPFFVDCGSPADREQLGTYDISNFLKQVDLNNSTQIKQQLESKNPALWNDIKSRIGVSALRSFLQQHLTKKLLGSAGALSNALDRKRMELQNDLKEKEELVKSLSMESLEKDLIKLNTAWWKIWKDLIEGTAYRSVIDEFGMTIEDERKEYDYYYDSEGKPLAPPLENIFGSRHKMLGGPQIKRIIDEFYEIAKVLLIESSSKDVVINSVRPGSIHSGIDIITSCSKIVCIESRRVLNPLIEQLVSRCGKVMQRLPGVCEKLVAQEAKAKKMEIREFEHFWDWLSRVCGDFNNETTKRCEEYTRFDFWAATEYIEIDDDYMLRDKINEIKSEVDKNIPPSNDIKATEDWTIDSVSKIVPILFQILVTNFFKNAKRKLHVFFLLGFGENAPDPSMTLYATIQKEFRSLDINKLFDLDSIKEKYDEDAENARINLETIETITKSLSKKFK